ncbi:tetratricopeptide repeat protein [Actinoplanes bogorensis]|uniref:Tetratricopeptide repeat protein n=1 Tax=Paractinoplanes bogorensis TaxID=1610840 RepID=A0ABS5YLX0_9ACTN|nr:tetratricopeptide repeat protein [Actinoplanes bogorensis]
MVAGMGGVGKTQLAANLAEHLWQARAVDLLLWVTATSRDSVINTYAQADADLTGTDDPDPQRAAVRLLGWLASTGKRWLVILDDVADPQALAGLWPPDTRYGRTVVTTRRRDAALLDGRHLVDVGTFTPGQAADYLHGRLDPDRLAEADLLAADLGFLPLALAQAAIYIRDQDMTCAGYRDRLQRRRLDRMQPQVLPDGQQRAVTDTWGLSIELADTLTDRLAGVVLQLAAILDPNGIPSSLFTSQAAAGYYRQRLDRAVDGDDTRDAIRMLHRLGLADTVTDPDLDGELLRVHALVQRVVRESTPDPRQAALAHAAADALIQLWPDIERDTATDRLGQLLRVNTTALAAVAGGHLWHTLDGVGDAHAVFFQAGRSLGEIGLVAAAHGHFQQLHADVEQALGPDHRDTMNVRSDLARWRGEAGDPGGAATAFKQLFADNLRVLGPDHPDTLTARSNLARWRGLAGDAGGAATAYEQLLADYLRVLGPDHRHTMTIRANVAHWRGETGDPGGAATAFEQQLADDLRALGPDHPDTLNSRSNLAGWTGKAGDPSEAATKFEQLLTDQMRVLGPDHPDTLRTRANIAYWQGQAGDPRGATTKFEQLLTDQMRALGPDHPDTLRTRANIAYWQGQAGDPRGATTKLEQLLTDQMRALGPDHPDTLTTRANIAHWRGQAGDPREATTTFEQLLTDYIRVLGPDHPYTLTTRANIAYWRGRPATPAEQPPQKGSP